MIIRKGTQEDIDQAIELGKAYHLESPMGQSSMTFNEDKCRELCRYLLQNGLGIVAEDGGQLVGMMGAYITTHFFTDDVVAQDVLIYIKPSYRGVGLSKRLISVYIFWALEQGVKRENIFIGINSGINASKTEKIYQTLGFKRHGVTMRLGG
jgi:GNAT superfamily N-acetyltransferase